MGTGLSQGDIQTWVKGVTKVVGREVTVVTTPSAENRCSGKSQRRRH